MKFGLPLAAAAEPEGNPVVSGKNSDAAPIPTTFKKSRRVFKKSPIFYLLRRNPWWGLPHRQPAKTNRLLNIATRPLTRFST